MKFLMSCITEGSLSINNWWLEAEGGEKGRGRGRGTRGTGKGRQGKVRKEGSREKRRRGRERREEGEDVILRRRKIDLGLTIQC